jgi:hypothetical protein
MDKNASYLDKSVINDRFLLISLLGGKQRKTGWRPYSTLIFYPDIVLIKQQTGGTNDPPVC